MKKKIISCLMIVIVIVCSYFYAHIDKNSYIYHRNADTSTFYATGVLEKGETISQTFVAQENSIDGIYIKAAVSGDLKDVVLHYALLDENEIEVSKASISASELKNNKFNKLSLPEVTETKGKQYELTLYTDYSDERNGIAFYVEPGAQNMQELSIDGNETDGTLVVRTICHRFDLETMIVLLGMIAFITVFMRILYKMFK